MASKEEYQKNKEKYKQRARESYWKKHPGSRKFYHLTKEERELKRKQNGLEYGRRYYRENREARNTYSREWFRRNPDKRPTKEKRSEYAHRSNLRVKKECISFYSNGLNCCFCCGEKILEFLCIDHINGGGNKHRKEIGTRGSLYWWLKRNDFPSGFQISCHNCNQGRQINGGICPHKNLSTE